MTQDMDRAERLAQALRDNLRRRKAQARALDDTPPPSVSPEAARSPDRAS